MDLTFAVRLGITLFIAAWCIAVVGWAFGVIEAIGVWRLARWPFQIGPIAASLSEETPCPVGLAAESANETAQVKYRVVRRTCLFRRRFSLFELRWNTPLEVKGTISWTNGRLSTVGRYPLGVVVFFFGWLVGWTVGGTIALTQGHLLGAPFLAFGWVVGGGMMAHSRVLERKRFLGYAAEVTSALRGVAGLG